MFTPMSAGQNASAAWPAMPNGATRPPHHAKKQVAVRDALMKMLAQGGSKEPPVMQGMPMMAMGNEK